MQILQEVKTQLEAIKPVLRKRFQVDTIGIFVSYCRTEQREKSDIDILITLVEPNNFDLVNLVGLRQYLS
jgi:predicted nucleotidyltransferase